MSRALIVIDVQNDYFPGGVLLLHDAEEVEARIVSEIDRARAAGDRVVLIRHISPAETGLFAANGSGAAIRPAILGAAGAVPIVTKQLADAFQDTDLATHLDGVREIRICGMMTQNCVVFTAMSEAAAAFDVCVIGDLCAAPSEIVHKVALSALSSKLRVENAAGA